MELANLSYFILLLFLPLVHWILPPRYRAYCLLLGSYGFYAWWDFRYVPVLLGATILDFFLAQMIDGCTNASKKKRLLLLSISANLLILGFFKYLGFFSQIATIVFGESGGASKLANPAIFFIPLGISFYTFHSISYVVDVYRGKVKPLRSFVEYSVYVTFFPKLIAGPIERTEVFLPQLRQPRHLSVNLFFEAMGLLVFGYFFKLCLADRMSDLTGIIYHQPFSYSIFDRWIALYAYSIQIYADFLGYTKIAQGSALLFGIKLSDNFRSPYLAENIQDFWRRWHITLSTWFRDYLYIPLGGGRKFPLRNILITMALAGLWHGAGANFIFWGLYHGLLLVIFRSSKWPNFPRWINILFTFHLVSFGWILFKAKTLTAAGQFFMGLFDSPTGSNPVAGVFEYFAFFLSVGFLVHGLQGLFHRLSIADDRISFFKSSLLGGIFGLVLLLVFFIGARNANPFVYFQF